MEVDKVLDSKKNKIHPREKANFLSKLFFCWALPIFAKGYKKDLTEDDLYGPLKEHESSMLGDQMEEAWNQQSLQKNPSLMKALIRVFGMKMLFSAVLYTIIEFGTKMAQPIIISKLMDFYGSNKSKTTKEEAMYYAAGFVLSSFLTITITHSYMLNNMHLGMKIRIACCSLIYRKALKLSKSSLAETTIGQMVNLLSNDVNRFDRAVLHINHIWGAPTLTLVILYLMYMELEAAALSGTVVIIMLLPIQMFLGKKTSIFRLRTALKSDIRVRLMNEIITGIQVIKLYTWEKPFAKLVEIARREEIRQIRNNSIIKAIAISFPLFINNTAIYVSILTYVLTGNRPTAQYVFVVTSFFGMLRQPVTKNFSLGITQIAEAKVSARRIEKFLLFEEIQKYDDEKHINNGLNSNQSPKNNSGYDVGVIIENANAKWLKSSSENSITDLNFSVGSQQLVAIVGPVGSGKTSLLHIILKELPLTNGTLKVNGVISYASQEPWLFSGSVKQNILFGQKYDEKKYQEVIKICALKRDFSLLPYGDRTLVGDRGTTLSGGQKARINLARAIYKDADVYLLDDPLSAVDTHVGKQLFDECISDYLKNKCTILVTHQLQYLAAAHKIYLLEDGRLVQSGSYEELKNSGNDFTNLLEDNNEGEETEENVDESKKVGCKPGILKKSKSGEPELVKEQKATGKITKGTYSEYFGAAGNCRQTFLIANLFVVAQLLSSSMDYFITFWVNLEQKRDELNATRNGSQILTKNNTIALKEPNSSTSDGIEMEESSMMKFLNMENFIIIYSLLLGCIIIFTLTRSIWFYNYCVTASRNLHNKMFNNIVKATMQFFHTNPSGRILNRFSKDMGAIDEVLPSTFLDAVQIGLNVLSIITLVGIVNPWILLATVIILLILYFLRVIFLASSRDIKRMEGTTKSPVFSHLSASLQGLTTIRAFDAEAVLRREFDKHQDLHSSAFYMFLIANRTFGFWLDLNCVVYIALVIVSLLFIQNETYGGNVGLALTQAMKLTGMFQWGMRQWGELENQMTAVERVVEYTKIEPEKEYQTKEPPKLWPEHGSIKFDSISLSYSGDDSPVLNNVTFRINPKEKVGIVGRTGAGKSSLIVALFRLFNTEGTILIDNVDTKTITLQQLRSKISIIPQEPVLFSGSLRKNLDPFDDYQDEILWKALEDVELKSVVTDLPAGLDSKMSEGGSNFSVGQRQLLCLARAIIRNNKILVLDEATANVDPQTDALIQTTIREKFSDCTVLTIAHRLHTVVDSDKILVMDAGRVAQFDHPHVLLQDTEGLFYGLVKETGKAMAENLANIAEQAQHNLCNRS